MRIAKKLFAVVVVIAMLAGLSSVAFAAGTYNFDLKAERDGDDYVKVTLIAKDAVGFKSGSVTLKYDPSVVEYDSTEYGKDAAEVNDKVKAEENTFVGQPNGKTEGEVIYGFYFLDTLWSAKDFAAASKRGVTADVDTATFEAAVFYFKIVDKEAASATFTCVGSGDISSAEFSDTVALTNAAPEETDPEETEPEETDPEETDPEETDPEETDPEETEPEETDPEETDPVTPPTDKKDEPTSKKTEQKTDDKTDDKTEAASKESTTASSSSSTDVGPNTGDTGALAIACGVCALAAAAFVVTKKRK